MGTQSSLTPRGLEIVEEIYKDINHHEYQINVTSYDNLYSECKVQHNVGGSSQTVEIVNTPFEVLPMEMSCGLMNINGAPCHHFAAVVKSGRLSGVVTTMNVMPR